MFTLNRTNTTATGLGRLLRATITGGAKNAGGGGPVSAHAIKKQIKRICRKLGVHGRTELALRIATEVCSVHMGALHFNDDMEVAMPERWLTYALLSAAAASVIPILAKVGLKGVDANAATMLRSVVMTISLMTMGTVFGAWSKMHTLWRPDISTPNGSVAGESIGFRALTVVALTGVAGAVSWLFYYKALKLADASRVAPIDKLAVPMAIVLAVIILGERPSLVNWLGIALVCVGAFFAAIPNR